MACSRPALRRLHAWAARLRRLWLTRLHHEPACVLDGLAPDVRWPVAELPEATVVSRDGVVLLLDHRHPRAIEMLGWWRDVHHDAFDAGLVVVGIENLPEAQRVHALTAYRRTARAPVFAVCVRRPADRLLLREALVATRIAAALCRAG